MQGYASYPLKSERPLLSPPQPTRWQLRTDQGAWFRDEHGRRVLLRGVNLGGSSKFPMKAATHIVHKFYDYDHNTKGISFIGRPFPLNEADEHFARLRAWGLTFMRLLVTWEAVEHAGPGQYDEEYLSYLLQLVRRAKSFGISVFIDPHQDVFSRWTGGDGAPVWTLDAVGFNSSALHDSGAAYSHQGHILAKGRHAPLPMMIWYTCQHTLTHSRMHVCGPSS